MTSVISLGRLSARDVCQLRAYAVKTLHDDARDQVVVGIFCLYGSWNTTIQQTPDSTILTFLKDLTPTSRPIIQSVVGMVQVDESEDSLRECIGDDDAKEHVGPCPPEELPSIAVAMQSPEMEHARIQFVPEIQASELLGLLRGTRSSVPAPWTTAIDKAIDSILSDTGNNEHSKDFENGESPAMGSKDAIRIFVAGDRSSVGKSSVCLGLLGNLVAEGYKPSELAYIKPATQCEAPQLIEAYCKRVGIECVPVGPIVYYKGYTRAFLAGETESSDQLLQKAGKAVDEVARGKRLVMIDGVGFPAVGSICGTDNARVARASGYLAKDDQEGETRTPPAVLLVGGSGVGAAVDAFNLNATYFAVKNVPVIGAIFNKLSLEGFYSLENCKKQVTKYFNRSRDDRRPFGFVPLVPEIAGEGASAHVDDFIRIFGEHIDVAAIVQAAMRVKTSPAVRKDLNSNGSNSVEVRPTKRLKHKSTNEVLTREQIEVKAMQAGAAPSA